MAERYLGRLGLLSCQAGRGAGKSTLTAACRQLGFGYMTDEIAVLLESGLIRPFPKPLRLSTWSRAVLGVDHTSLAFVTSGFKAPVAPEDLGAVVVEGDVKVTLIRVRP